MAADLTPEQEAKLKAALSDPQVRESLGQHLGTALARPVLRAVVGAALCGAALGTIITWAILR